MGVERQQGGFYQAFLFEDWPESPRPDRDGEARSLSVRPEEPQASAARDPARALTVSLMEEVTDGDNLNRAYFRVRSNQGAAGVDGLSVDDLKAWIAAHKGAFIAALPGGSYRPQPVRGVEIPRPGGGVRQLGIPTVVDRLVQHAILQVLGKYLGPTFSVSSFGFRPGRGAHDALAQASRYVAESRAIVVDLDLEKFFDRVNHDILCHDWPGASAISVCCASSAASWKRECCKAACASSGTKGHRKGGRTRPLQSCELLPIRDYNPAYAASTALRTTLDARRDLSRFPRGWRSAMEGPSRNPPVLVQRDCVPNRLSEQALLGVYERLLRVLAQHEEGKKRRTEPSIPEPYFLSTIGGPS